MCFMQNLSCFTYEIAIMLLLLTLHKILGETECCKWLVVLCKELIPNVLTAYLAKTPLYNNIYWCDCIFD
jgi:hypothetical protein